MSIASEMRELMKDFWGQDTLRDTYNRVKVFIPRIEQLESDLEGYKATSQVAQDCQEMIDAQQREREDALIRAAIDMCVQEAFDGQMQYGSSSIGSDIQVNVTPASVRESVDAKERKERQDEKEAQAKGS